PAAGGGADPEDRTSRPFAGGVRSLSRSLMKVDSAFTLQESTTMSSSRTRHHRFLFAAAPLLAFLVWLPLAPARADVHRQCTAILDPDTVAVQTEPVIVGYAVPDSIGLITAVTPAEDSGIVSGRIDAEAQTVEIQ